MTKTELASSYAALILADSKHEITPEKINAITSAAGVEVEPIWANLLAKALEGKTVKDLLANVGSSGSASTIGGAPAAAAGGAAVVAPTEEEEEDDDCDFACFGLFD
ncbi:hypothetical protein FRB94_003519 [Tulasnella sp. JGI-2019a]|nr:hypothetical protein FRB93_010422 [Tulasnella sp. JGI-2019a]KAG9002896.1 hypothetical protein FRB94_003519 [Tulasnella sp. JGI-2019a]KAG9024960.1 hypothetical protein FRB95_010843 [Tulasnella sp. JGI-2019a]